MSMLRVFRFWATHFTHLFDVGIAHDCDTGATGFAAGVRCLSTRCALHHVLHDGRQWTQGESTSFAPLVNVKTAAISPQSTVAVCQHTQSNRDCLCRRSAVL